MITTCTECQARYELDATKVPPRLIKVRCPSCSGVFSLDGTQAAKAEPVVTEATAAVVDTPLVTSDPIAAPAGAPVAPASAVPSSAQPQVQEQAGVAVLEETPRVGNSARRRRSKEEMLARALVSDILVYNKEQRDEALANGTLLETLGGEIKKSWELYKEKVTPEVANSSNYFREALNDILAEGDKIF